jgi:hypothetical protein
MASFLRSVKVTRDGDDCLAAIDADWFIWGPFGGYLAALALRAMASYSNLPRPAAFSCQFLKAAAAGPVSFVVERRKSGRRAQLLRACAMQAGEPFLDAQCWFVAGDLTGLTYDSATMPPVETPFQLPPWDGFDDDESKSPIWKYIDRRPPRAWRSFGAVPAAPAKIAGNAAHGRSCPAGRARLVVDGPRAVERGADGAWLAHNPSSAGALPLRNVNVDIH